jgi:hypothetical protein
MIPVAAWEQECLSKLTDIKIMERVKYLILAEFERYGFLYTVNENLEVAKLLCSKIFYLSDKYSFDYILSKLLKKSIATYEINGNELYASKTIWGHSNGIYSVSIIEINPDTFCIKTFIKERQNCSTVFDWEEYENELEYMAQRFPKLCIGAN